MTYTVAVLSGFFRMSLDRTQGPRECQFLRAALLLGGSPFRYTSSPNALLWNRGSVPPLAPWSLS